MPNTNHTPSRRDEPDTDILGHDKHRRCMDLNWDYPVPSCKDCIFVPEGEDISITFYCQIRKGRQWFKDGVCGLFEPSYSSLDEFLERYPHMRESFGV